MEMFYCGLSPSAKIVRPGKVDSLFPITIRILATSTFIIAFLMCHALIFARDSDFHMHEQLQAGSLHNQ